MKKCVVFLILLVISIPIVNAKSTVIEELFDIVNPDQNPPLENPAKEGATSYFYAGSRLIATKLEITSKDINKNDLYYNYQDRLNNNRLDGKGNKYKTLPFGQVLIDSPNKFEFTGKELDEDSNLHYFNARYYDSNVGKFTSVDPLPDQQPYAYVANNPMNYIDPLGTEVGDPTENEGYVENMYGAPVDTKIYEKWRGSRDYYDKLEANPGTFNKVLLFLHPDYDNFEDWDNALLKMKYPEMYYNPNPTGPTLREVWDQSSGLEKTVHTINAVIYLITVFGGPFALASQAKQTNPVRPTRSLPPSTPKNKDASSPARSSAARDKLARTYRDQYTMTEFQMQGYWKIMSHRFQTSQGNTVRLSPHAARQTINKQISVEQIQQALSTQGPIRQRSGNYEGTFLFVGDDVSVAVNPSSFTRGDYIRTVYKNNF